jgi:hypothetical protein
LRYLFFEGGAGGGGEEFIPTQISHYWRELEILRVGESSYFMHV